MQKNIKTADLQGVFYPSGKDELNNLLEYLLTEGNRKKLFSSKIPKGIVVPHAGYAYSGSCAATAYNVLSHYVGNYDVVYIFGPSHQKYFDGLKTLTKEYYATPLGDLQIAQQEITNLVDEDLLSMDDKVFEGEHSLEVQLPFIYKIFGKNIKIVPILVGNASANDIVSILYKMNEVERRLFIISSDLSHFLSLEEEQAVDQDTINNVEHLNNTLIDHGEACGATALNGAIEYAKLEGLQAENIDFKNSSEVSNDEDRVVGYASFLIY